MDVAYLNFIVLSATLSQEFSLAFYRHAGIDVRHRFIQFNSLPASFFAADQHKGSLRAKMDNTILIEFFVQRP